MRDDLRCASKRVPALSWRALRVEISWPEAQNVGSSADWRTVGGGRLLIMLGCGDPTWATQRS